MEFDELKFNAIILALMLMIIGVKLAFKCYWFDENVIDALDAIVCILFGIGLGATWIGKVIDIGTAD